LHDHHHEFHEKQNMKFSLQASISNYTHLYVCVISRNSLTISNFFQIF
jgi:hypothetical protein